MTPEDRLLFVILNGRGDAATDQLERNIREAAAEVGLSVTAWARVILAHAAGSGLDTALARAAEAHGTLFERTSEGEVLKKILEEKYG